VEEEERGEDEKVLGEKERGEEEKVLKKNEREEEEDDDLVTTTLWPDR
jgi:hypothetical protein